jgi:hypothetical protein
MFFLHQYDKPKVHEDRPDANMREELRYVLLPFN